MGNKAENIGEILFQLFLGLFKMRNWETSSRNGGIHAAAGLPPANNSYRIYPLDEVLMGPRIMLEHLHGRRYAQAYWGFNPDYHNNAL